MPITNDLFVLTFGEQLRHYRERAGLTQEELADEAGLTEKAIGALERGERRTPYPRTVQALLQALQLTDDERASLLLAWSAAKEQQRAASAQSAPRKQPPGDHLPAPAQPPAPDLLATRVLPPPPRPMAVSRPRLLQRLQLAPASGVTIVIAPAGFGKTTLLTAWIATLSAEQATRVAWLALEIEDADPARLLRYQITALQRVAPQLGQSALALLDTQQPAQPIAVLTLLINDLAQLAQPLTLILDDYHLLRGSANQQMLRFLVDHIPPQLRLVIASREDPPLPLTQLRARGQLTELRATDLRFTTNEASAFLIDAMGLALDSQAILTLEQRTEGWAAGLQLAALALRDRADQADFLRSFAGSHRLVLDYLAEEVLDRLPRHMQTFLLQTSVLDRLCGPLCDAVLLGSTEHGDRLPSDQELRSLGSNAYSQLILEEIERANLFVVPLDDMRGWYRYHHLFGEVLRARLLHGASPATIRLLHGRAAAWYATQNLWHEAIPHALAARQWDLAAQAITAVGDDLLLQNANDTLRRLIEAVPEPERDMYPALLLLQGLSAARDYNLRRAAGYLQQAAVAFAAAGDHTGRGAALLHLSDCQRSIGEFEAAHASLEQALATPLPPRHHLNALISRAYEAVAIGDGSRAITALEEALTLTAASDDRWLRYELAINTHSLLLILPGGIDWAERLSRLARSWPTPPLSPLRAALAWISGFSSLLRGELAEASAQISQAMDIGEQLGGINKLSIDAGLYHAVVLALCGDPDGADRRFIALRTLLDQAALAAFTQSWGALHHYCVGWLRWQQGRLDEARAIVREMEATTSPAEWPTAPCARLLLRGLVASADGDTQQAETLLLAALTEQQRFADALMLGDARMLLGYNALRANRPEAALTFVSAALDAQIQRGTPGVLLIQGAVVAVPLLQLASAHQIHSTVAGRLLRALNQTGSPAETAAPTIDIGPDMLTPRELEVLRLLARGTSNKTIADTLVISLHTTKTHVAHILDKLGAASRSEAAALARELGLI